MLWKEYMPKELAEFRALYSKLADKMRTVVYELKVLMRYRKKAPSMRIVLFLGGVCSGLFSFIRYIRST